VRTGKRKKENTRLLATKESDKQSHKKTKKGRNKERRKQNDKEIYMKGKKEK
jgi:hypothetical protein